MVIALFIEILIELVIRSIYAMCTNDSDRNNGATVSGIVIRDNRTVDVLMKTNHQSDLEWRRLEEVKSLLTGQTIGQLRKSNMFS